MVQQGSIQSIEAVLVATFGVPSGGHDPGEFRNPCGLATDSTGALIVADAGNHRVQKLSSGGDVQWVRGGRDAVGHPLAGTASSEFSAPLAVSVGPDDSIYVCDSGNCRIKRYSPSGELLTIFGSQGNDEGQFGGVGPEGIDVSPEGLVFVADSHTIRGGNNRIQVFDPGGHFLSQFSSYGTTPYQFAGSVPIREYGYDSGPGLNPGPEGPVGIGLQRNPIARDFAYMRKDTLFCADTDNARLLRLTALGESFGVFGVGHLLRPRQVSVDSNDNVYVTDLHTHTPIWSTRNPTSEYIWSIEPNASWVWVFDRRGTLIGRVGDPITHRLYVHDGAGVHSHGAGVAVSRADDTTLFVQVGHLIARWAVSIGPASTPSGGIPTILGGQ